MHANAIALSTLLLGAGLLGSERADAVTITGSSTRASVMTEQTGDPFIQLADGGKLGDKYMSGKAGGRYGVGGKDRQKTGK